MATATQAIHSAPVCPPARRQAKAAIPQRQLAAVLQMRQELAQLSEVLGTAEDRILAALMAGQSVQPGPVRAFEQAWEEARYEGSFSHVVLVDSSAGKGERKAQALYWRPGQCRFPKRIERELAQAVA